MNGLMDLRIIYGCFPLTVFMYACRSTYIVDRNARSLITYDSGVGCSKIGRWLPRHEYHLVHFLSLPLLHVSMPSTVPLCNTA